MTKLLFTLAACMIFTPAAFAETCQDKVKSIQSEIDYARKNSNTKRLSGLEVALKNAQNNCTDAKLLEKQESKIHARQKDIDKAQKELDTAIAEKRSQKKIIKMQRKLEEQKQELLQEIEN